MSGSPGKIFVFGEFCLDVDERSLTSDGQSVALTPKVFDLLVLLIENRGHLMAKEDLIETLWGDSFVEEANLNVNISALRRSLRETPSSPRFVETVPKRGYRFIGEVSETYHLPDELAADGPATITEARAANGIWINTRRLIVPLAIIAMALAAIAVWRYAARDAEAGEVRTIAILPFTPLTGDQKDEALELGMADALITRLGSLSEIDVRPTSAISKFASGSADPLGAGRELQVDAVLDGKVQRADNRVRVTVQLLKVSDGSIIWSDSFEDYFTNIFAVQDSISDKMASALAVKISSRERERLVKRQTESTEAYALYLQGRYYNEMITEEGSRKAIVYYRAAIDKDPQYALAYATLTGVLAHMVNIGVDREVNLQAARDSAARAVTLDPDLAEAHEAVATLKDAFDWDWAGAEAEYKRALDLDPDSLDAHYSYSILLSHLKRHEEAVREIELAKRLNPTALYIQNQLALTYFRAKRTDDAIAACKRSIEMDPQDKTARSRVIKMLLIDGQVDEARRALDEFQGFSEQGRKLLSAEIDLHTNKRPEAERYIRDVISKMSPMGNRTNIASLYASLGETDKAFEMLEEAFAQHEAFLVTLNVERDWDTIRDDPRYFELIRKLNLPA